MKGGDKMKKLFMMVLAGALVSTFSGASLVLAEDAAATATVQDAKAKVAKKEMHKKVKKAKAKKAAAAVVAK